MWVVNFNNRYPYCQNNPLKYTDPTGWDDDDGTMAGYLTGMSNSSDMSMSLTAWVGSLFNASSYGSQSGLGIGQTVASITGFVPNAQLLNGETSPDAQTATLTNLYKNGNGDQVAVYTLTSGPNAGTQSAVFISAAGAQTPMDPGTAMLLMDASSTVNFDKNVPYSKASNDGGPMMAYAPPGPDRVANWVEGDVVGDHLGQSLEAAQTQTEGEIGGGNPSGIGLSRQLGIDGENAVGVDQAAKESIESLTGTAKYRIPDILDENAGVLGEVKNVQYLGVTNQLTDFALYSQQQELQFTIYTRSTTVYSGPMSNFINQFNVLIKTIPGY